MIGQEDLLSPELPSSPIGTEFPGGKLPLGISSRTSHLDTRGNSIHISRHSFLNIRNSLCIELHKVCAHFVWT